MTGSETHLGACRIAGPDACRRILLCGEDNPLSSDPRYALYHQPPRCAGHRLQSYILGVDPRRTYLPIWRTNLCTGGWDRTAAVDRAEQLIGDAPWDIIVALGAKVCDARRLACHGAIMNVYNEIHSIRTMVQVLILFVLLCCVAIGVLALRMQEAKAPATSGCQTFAMPHGIIGSGTARDPLRLRTEQP